MILTIELPEPLTQKAQGYGISPQQLQDLMIGYIQNLLTAPAQRHHLPLNLGDNPISDDINADLAQLDYLDDADLWQAAQTQLPVADTAKMQTLLDKQQHEGLTVEEQTLAHILSQRYQKTMLVRAKATGLLHQRGIDISQLRSKRPKR